MMIIVVNIKNVAGRPKPCARKRPPAGEPAPAIPVGAKRAPTTEELTTPDAQAKPARSDELLKRSEQREPDDFDLPPPG